MSCICISIFVVYLFFPPPLSYCPVVSTSAADAPVIDYFVDDRTPTVELTGKQSHSLPQISPTFPYFLALGIVTAAATITILFNCIACFCRPLMYLYFILCCLLLLLHYSAVNPAHC